MLNKKDEKDKVLLDILYQKNPAHLPEEQIKYIKSIFYKNLVYLLGYKEIDSDEVLLECENLRLILNHVSTFDYPMFTYRNLLLFLVDNEGINYIEHNFPEFNYEELYDYWDKETDLNNLFKLADLFINTKNSIDTETKDKLLFLVFKILYTHCTNNHLLSLENLKNFKYLEIFTHDLTYALFTKPDFFKTLDLVEVAYCSGRKQNEGEFEAEVLSLMNINPYIEDYERIENLVRLDKNSNIAVKFLTFKSLQPEYMSVYDENRTDKFIDYVDKNARHLIKIPEDIVLYKSEIQKYRMNV